MRLSSIKFLALQAFCVVIGNSPAFAQCDDLAGRIIKDAVGPAVAQADCGPLGRAGLDRNAHSLSGVCYESSGAVSTIRLDVALSCKTSDAAFIRASVSENVSATASIRGSDCAILDVKVEANGDIGKVLVKAFKVDGLARTALANGLTRICR